MSLETDLQAVYDRLGELTPEAVLDEARDEASPLHSRFEWDDSIAGENWRKHQAGELIRSVKVVYREATDTEAARTARAYQSVRGPNGHAYQPSEKVAADPLMRRMVLADMEREWKTLRRRYERFEEFAEMVGRDMKQAA